MKRTLIIKICGSYLIFAILIAMVLTTYTEKTAQDYLTQKEAEQLYRQSTILASDLRSSFRQGDLTFPNLQDSLEITGGYLGAEIWIIDSRSNILLDSSDKVVHKQALNQDPFQISDFRVDDFGNNFYQIGTFYSKFKEPTMTVFSPITVDYRVRGYVLIHKPMTSVLNNSGQIVNIVFLSSSVIFLCSLLLLVSFLILVYRPMGHITKGARAFAKGDFKDTIKVTGHDEIGYIAQTMNYMATELDTLEDEQKKFISNVSHDFRSPLTSIKGYIEAMIDGTIPVEMQEKYLNIILFETERLNKLTQGILDLNRFRGQGMMLDISEFDINNLIRNTLMTSEGTCSKKGISFDLVLTEQELFVCADMTKIQQVLYNLVDNAIKFSHNNSVITIETTIKNGKVFVSVKDRGIGIPSDSVKKIWERFYKTDLSRGKDKKGTGLGLSIVKEIISAHNENINVISTEGVGTEFIFSLSLAEREM